MKSDTERKHLAGEISRVLNELERLNQDVQNSDREDYLAWSLRVDPELNKEWLSSVESGGRTLAAQYEQTLSWRVTKPLRLFRKFQMSVRHRGLSASLHLLGQRLKTRLKR